MDDERGVRHNSEGHFLQVVILLILDWEAIEEVRVERGKVEFFFRWKGN